MKNISLAFSVLTFTLFAVSPVAHSATKVIQINADTLKVVVFNGHPPFKRYAVKKSTNPERFQHYLSKVHQENTKTIKNNSRIWHRSPFKR